MIALSTREQAPLTRTEWLVAELTRPAAYPRHVERVDVRRTLVSLLFFAGERVYKVKQELDLGFIDARTLARRRFLCAEEVRLNARLAPGIHVGVVPITQASDGHLVFGGTGQVLEWAVEMIRLPEDRMLASLLERGVIDNAQMNALAGVLATFHAEAARGPGVDELGSPACIGVDIEENFDQLRAFVARPEGMARPALAVLTPVQHAFLRMHARGFLVKQRELLLTRIAAGHIREGHGDLHAENVCQLPDRFVIYDRIEFSQRLRCLDVASDLAFLAMDLDYRGFPGFGAYLVHRYAELTHDHELQRLLGFYKGYRALVRAKVAALGARSPGVAAERCEELRRESMRYVQLALGYELRPALVLLAGLPASGKSFLAGHVARPLRAAVLHSDERRKRLAGLSPGTSARAQWGQALYTPEERRRTYRSLLEDALRTLRSGRSVVVDASFARREFRQPFVDAATRLGLAYCIVHVEAPEAIVRTRMAVRGLGAAADGASDADFGIYLKERAAFEAPDEVPWEHVLSVHSGEGAPEDDVARLFERLIALEGSD